VDHVTTEDMIITSHRGAGFSAVDSLEFRRALGHFATGVTVVTYAPEDADEFRGTTVNSFTSVSLEPPLVLVSLGRATRAAAALRPGSAYAVNVLHHGQRDLALWFASRPRSSSGGTAPRTPRSSPEETRVEWEVRAGVPHLAGCAAYFRCVVQDVHGAGDHVLVVGLVKEFQAHGHQPLLFYRGTFERLPSPAAAQSDDEMANNFLSDFPELW
jgi:flavin reductase (DIM6/NTAB) family NADH-FMN oxidoreductase RutF